MSNSKDINMIEIKIDGYFYSLDNIKMKSFSSLFTKFLEENQLEFIGTTKEVIDESTDKTVTINNELIALWSKAVDIMDFYLPRISLETWIKPIIPYSLKEKDLVLIAPNDFIRGLLIKSYVRLMKVSLKEVNGINYNIEIIVKDEEVDNTETLVREIDYT